MLRSNPETTRAWQERSRQRQRENPKPRVAVRKVSKKQARANRQYSAARAIHMEEHPHCERCKAGGHEVLATDVHHMAGRDGDRMTDPENFLSVCRYCHEYLHAHPQEAKQLGYSRSRHR